MSIASPSPAGRAGSAVERAITGMVGDGPLESGARPRLDIVIHPDSPLFGAAVGGDGADAPVEPRIGWSHRPEEPAADAPSTSSRPTADDGQMQSTEARRAEREALWRERMRAEALDAAAALALPASSGPAWVAALGVVPSDSTVTELLDVLADTHRAAAMAEARRMAAVVALIGVEPSGSSSAERQKADEIAHALGLSILAAEWVIHRARMLAGPFEVFGAGLAEGRVSFGHCLALIAQTTAVQDPDTLRAIAEAAITHTSKVVSRFRTAVAAIIAELDRDALERRRRAKDSRTVYVQRGTDGMSALHLIHQTQVVNALMAQLGEDGAALQAVRLADRGAAEAAEAAHGDTAGVDVGAAARGAQLVDGDLSPAACRADALVARVLGQRHDDGTVTWAPSADQRVTVEVVIDHETLLGLRDGVALLDGEPVPADVARDLVDAATWFRRVVVDPVDGYLLDYGDRVYLPPRLKKFVLKRDGGCRNPSCTRRDPRSLELDHAEEFPRGPSSAGNGGALCRRCHHRKTLGLLDLTASQADGSATLTSAWGQTVRIPARSYLPRVREPDPPTEPLEPRPF